MSKVLFSFTWEGVQPSIQQVAEHFGFNEDSFDKDFDVVEIDREADLYCISIEQSELKDRGREDQGFSNPKIEPFDLPEE